MQVTKNNATRRAVDYVTSFSDIKAKGIPKHISAALKRLGGNEDGEQYDPPIDLISIPRIKCREYVVETLR